MNEYITEEGKINDVNAVKAQADQTPAACSCACIQDLHNYVLTVDFINALQNIRTMINDALNNTDLSEIYKKLLLEIRTKLTDVWKHVGLIEDESNQQHAVKQKLLNLPQDELRQGDTRVLTYAKTIEGETAPKQVNDLYVYLGQASGPDAIDEATETSEHISKKWVKILTMEFNDDDSEDINLDDIIRRLKAMEDRIGEAIRIVTSIWAYLCKNWWEFVDTADTVEEITSKPNPVLAQNYYCKSDNNIYIYLRTGGTLDEPTMRWIPILNANNIPYSSSVWRHTKVVDKNSWDPTTADAGEFFGQTVYRMGTFNGNGETTDRRNPAYGTIFVWLPTMSNGSEDIGSSAKWVPLSNENTLQQTWRHTKVVPDKPNEGTGSNGAGSFIGETRYSVVSENIVDKPKGDVYVWLPTTPGTPGTDFHWFNITRNKEVNSISNYSPENIVVDVDPSQLYGRFKAAVTNNYLRFSMRIERYGQMVQFNENYTRGDGPADAVKVQGYNFKSRAAHGSGFYMTVNKDNGAITYPGETSAAQREANKTNGWNYVYRMLTQYVPFNIAWGNKQTAVSNKLWRSNSPGYLYNFTQICLQNIFDCFITGQNYPKQITVDGEKIVYIDDNNHPVVPDSGVKKMKELCIKYKCANNAENINISSYRKLATKFFIPATGITLDGYSEYWSDNNKRDFDDDISGGKSLQDICNHIYELSGNDVDDSSWSMAQIAENTPTPDNKANIMYSYIASVIHQDPSTCLYGFNPAITNIGTSSDKNYVPTVRVGVYNSAQGMCITGDHVTNGSIDIKTNGIVTTPFLDTSTKGNDWFNRPYLFRTSQSYVGRSMYL